MNVHDSERLSGLLEAAGYTRAADGDDATSCVHTCAVRRTPTTSSTATSASGPAQAADPSMQIAVGGCLAEGPRFGPAEGALVDVVFGTHNIGSLPVLLERARHQRVAQVEIAEALQEFPSALPASRESAYAAWVSISVGCNNTCTSASCPRCAARR
jgi:tRNA-2-methylthio-N6-dimethylallyladenosine synthase